MRIALIETKRKERERLEKLLRRFNRSVQQSGILSLARKKKFYEKEPSKREKREEAKRKSYIKELRRKRREGY